MLQKTRCILQYTTHGTQLFFHPSNFRSHFFSLQVWLHWFCLLVQRAGRIALAMGACMCVPTLWHASNENLNILPARFHLTDHHALDVCSLAGQTLTANINALQTLGYNGGIPTPQIDGFDIPRKLVAEANVIIIGSPHGHLSDGTHYTSESSRQFKQNLIIS